MEIYDLTKINNFWNVHTITNVSIGVSFLLEWFTLQGGRHLKDKGLNISLN